MTVSLRSFIGRADIPSGASADSPRGLLRDEGTVCLICVVLIVLSPLFLFREALKRNKWLRELKEGGAKREANQDAGSSSPDWTLHRERVKQEITVRRGPSGQGSEPKPSAAAQGKNGKPRRREEMPTDCDYEKRFEGTISYTQGLNANSIKSIRTIRLQ
jgi:hypothetical protein